MARFLIAINFHSIKRIVWNAYRSKSSQIVILLLSPLLELAIKTCECCALVNLWITKMQSLRASFFSVKTKNFFERSSGTCRRVLWLLFALAAARTSRHVTYHCARVVIIALARCQHFARIFQTLMTRRKFNLELR